MSKCINCGYLKVVEENYYDSDNVRRTDVRYVCSLSGIERDVMKDSPCVTYKERKKNDTVN